jgi:hypothetical protein
MTAENPELMTAQIDQALAAVAALGDSEGGAQARELARVIMNLYGAGLARVMEIAGGADSRDVLDRLTRDPLISSLLALHGLHPEPLEDRIRGALLAVQPALPAGVETTLVSVADGRVTVRVACPAAAPVGHGDIRRALSRAIHAAAPEVEAVHIEGLGDGLLQIIRAPQQVAPAPSHG